MKPGEKVGTVVELPIQERFVGRDGETVFAKRELMEVDGVGLHVYYSGDNIPTIQEIKSYLIGIRSKILRFEAPTVGAALNRFISDYPGATTGTRAKALQFDDGKFARIRTYPECPRMHYANDGSFVCGELMRDGLNGEFGGCVLSDYDPPEFECPVVEFWKKESWEKP